MWLRLADVRTLVGALLMAALVAVPAHADTFRVRALGDHDWSPSAGSVQQAGPTPVQVVGALSDRNGSAPYNLAAGPGIVRDTLTGSFTNPAFLTLRFNPATLAVADQNLTIVGPAGFVTTSLNVHVDGIVQHVCGSMRACQTDVQVTVRVNGHNHITFVGTRSGVVSNQLGLSVTPTVNGFRLHGDKSTPPFTVATNQPFPVLLRIDVKATHLGNGSTSTSSWSADFDNTVSFAPRGPVLNLPAGYDVVGGGVVGNRWRNPFRSDDVAPVVTGVPDREPNANGWYRDPVTIDWQSVDPEPSSGTPSDPPDTIAGQEGQDVPYESEPSCDPADNCATGTLVLSIDRTPPAVTCQAPEPVFLLGEPGAEVSATLADNLSGPAAEGLVAPADTATVGQKTAAFTGQDLAGNETTTVCPYRVEYRFEGFASPVENAPALNDSTAGRTVPLAWRVTDAFGAPVTGLTRADLSAVSLACDLGTTADQPAERSPGDTGLQDLGDGYYQLNWRTPRAYQNSCKTLRLDLGEGIHRTALFRFRR